MASATCDHYKIAYENSLLNWIPVEVRGKIFNNLSQPEILQCRLVCQTWRQEIDQFYNFHVIIDDELKQMKWERILQLSVTSIEIHHFLHPPLYGLATKCFKFPSLLTSLKMTSSKILPENLYYLLSDCAKSLKKMCLKLGDPLLYTVFQTPLSDFNFTKLEILEISCDTSPEFTSGPDFVLHRKTPNLFIELLQCQMKQLKHLKLELKLVGLAQVSCCTISVINFLSNRNTTTNLKTLDFELIQGRHGLPFTEPSQQINDPDDARIKQIFKFDQLRNLEGLRIINSSSIEASFWTNLIRQQKKLIFLEVDFLPLPISMFAELIFINSTNLVHVELTDLQIWNMEGYVHPFDMSIFANCNSLKKIILDRHVNIADCKRRYDCAEIVNLYQIPVNLEEIALNYFNILSEDLVLLCVNHRNSELKNVTLTQCGNCGSFGVTGSVLEELLSLNSVCFVEISTMNFEKARERMRLNSILNEYGYSENHAYFQMSKLENVVQ